MQVAVPVPEPKLVNERLTLYQYKLQFSVHGAWLLLVDVGGGEATLAAQEHVCPQVIATTQHG